MLSSEENPAAFSFLVGLVVLVLAGVGLSLMVDRRFEFSSTARDLRKDLVRDAEVLERLRDRVADYEANYLAQQNRGSQERYVQLTERSAELGNVSTSLSALLAELRAEVEAIDASFSQYRADYRRLTWARAEGQALGDLRVRGGREYRDATVKKVTPVGLEINHANGLARIQAPDLDAAYQDRFQWNAEERHRVLEAERAVRERMTRSGSALAKPAGKVAAAHPPAATPAAPEASPQRSDIPALRMKVQAWRAKVNVLRAQSNEAEFNAVNGGRVSVPGSLETWQARRNRIRSELERAGAELAAARSRLAAVSPGDSLLEVRISED